MSDLATDVGDMQMPLQVPAAAAAAEFTAPDTVALPGIGLWTLCAKRGLDIVVSATLLIVLIPLFLLIACALARTGRPILFAQDRVGLGGRVFRCLKFRSMVPGAEEILDRLLQQDPVLQQEWMQGQKLKVDFRVTKLGAILRKTSLDELPQLWNVLLGEMSLVGPRPALPNQLPLYGPLTVLYTAVRPGITGLWQVEARGDGNFLRRIEFDAEYVRSFSFWKDIGLLLKTLRVVFSGKGAY